MCAQVTCYVDTDNSTHETHSGDVPKLAAYYAKNVLTKDVVAIDDAAKERELSIFTLLELEQPKHQGNEARSFRWTGLRGFESAQLHQVLN